MRTLINKFLPAWLFLFSLLVFAPSLTGDFVMDDWPVVKENSRITDTKFIPDYFSQGVWANTDLATEIGQEDHSLYRPLFLIMLNVSHHLWGDNAMGYHALNIILHGINTVLLYFIILGFLPSGSRMIAAMSTAIFAVHPSHVESVAWIAGITDPLVSLFLFSTFLLHRRATQHTNTVASIAAPACFALALLSKETAVFFPLILLIFDGLFHRDTLRTKSGIGRYAAYAVLLLVYFLLRSNALDSATGSQSSIWERIELQNLPVMIEFFIHYFKLLFLPWPLEFYYQAPATSIFTLIFGSLIIISAIAYTPRAVRNKNALYIMAISWSLITLLPALPIALFAEPVFAHRVLYLPTAGLSLFIAYLLTQTQHSPKALEASIKTAVVLLLFSFAISSMTEIEDWENDTKFYSAAMKSNPDSYRPVSGLASAYARENNIEPAIDLYQKAAELAAGNSHNKNQLDFLENAALLAGQSGKTSQSEKLYREITQRTPQRSSAWVGLGNNALARKDQQQALEFYHKAFEADPNNRIASHNLALVYRQMGRLERAAYFQRRAQSPQHNQ